MKTTHVTLKSKDLARSLDVEVYGEAGRPVIALPEGDSSFDSWSRGGMVDVVSDLIEAGRIRLVCTDSADDLGWYSRYAVPEYRLANIRSYFRFVEKDLLPLVGRICGEGDGAVPGQLPVLVGAGMGALNACDLVLSKPQLFGGLLALSGTYDARSFVSADDEGLPDGWKEVSPVDVVRALPQRGKALGLLRRMPLAFVCGTGQGEDGLGSQRALEVAFAEREIPATFEYWGADVTHDWRWWQEELRQMLPAVLKEGGLRERRLSAELAEAERRASDATSRLGDLEDRLSAARDALKIAEMDVKATAKRAAAEERSVERCGSTEMDLASKARDAWAVRDRAREALEKAEDAARKAQAKADAATKSRQDAEWILGEARSAADQAVANRDAAKRAVDQSDANVVEATKRNASAQEALEAARSAMEEG